MLKLVLTTCLLAVAFGGIIPLEEQEIDGFIVGGHDTDITKAPYQISLHIQGHFACGGSVVAKKYIVTAAHCVHDRKPEDLTVRAGSTKPKAGGVHLKVVKIKVHPRYSPSRNDKDIAVLELEKPLTYSDKIKPIALATKEPTAPGTVQTSGWGALQESGGLPDVLQSVEVPVVDRKTCQEAYDNYRIKITEFMVCAGKEGKDSCQGDSGGPLVQNGKLAGVVSFGVGCARKNFAGVYVNVANSEITSFVKEAAKL